MLMHAEGTRLEHLRQPPFNTTMMGVLKGAADYYGLNLDAPMIYGLSGHAFLINIHTQLCPSGPYCWKREHAAPLIKNLGIRMNDLGFFEHNAPAAVPAAGAAHGNWWNAIVWSECRQMAAAYFVAIGNANERVADRCTQLNAAYLNIAGNLQKASDKTLASEKKIALLKETKHLEAEAMKKVQQLTSALRAQAKP